MQKQKVIVGDQELEIECAPVTLIFKDPKLWEKFEYPDAVRLTYIGCLNYYRQAPLLTPMVKPLVDKVFGPSSTYGGPLKEGWEYSKEYLKNHSDSVKSMIGRIEATFYLTLAQKNIVWVEPEAGLHPTSQLELADLSILFSDWEKLKAFLSKGISDEV